MMAHQQEFIDKHAFDEHHALFWEMGTGKTYAVINNAVQLYLSSLIDMVVIVAPNGVHRNWAYREIPKGISSQLHYNVFVYKSGYQSKEYKQQFSSFINDIDSLRFLIVNVDTFSRKNGKDIISGIMKEFDKRVLLVVDESTTVKSSKSTRGKNVVSLRGLADYRRIMTGTVITQSPLDAWNQCEILRKAALGYNSFFGFSNYFGISEKKFYANTTFYYKVNY